MYFFILSARSHLKSDNSINYVTMWKDHKINFLLAWIILVLVLTSFIIITIMLVQSPNSTDFITVLTRYLPLCFWTIVGIQLTRCSGNHATIYDCDDTLIAVSPHRSTYAWRRLAFFITVIIVRYVLRPWTRVLHQDELRCRVGGFGPTDHRFLMGQRTQTWALWHRARSRTGYVIFYRQHWWG